MQTETKTNAPAHMIFHLLLWTVRLSQVLAIVLLCRSIDARPPGKQATEKPAAAATPEESAVHKRSAMFDVFGPELLGLGPNDEMRITYDSGGRFSNVSYEFLFRGSEPERVRAWQHFPFAKPPREKRDAGSVALSPNDWRQLARTLTRYRIGPKARWTWDADTVTVSLSTKEKKAVRFERFVDRSGIGHYLHQLCDRFSLTKWIPPAANTPFLEKSYPVGNLAAQPGASGKTTYDVAPLAGLIYELIHENFGPDSWEPGNGGGMDVAGDGETLLLRIRQTAEAHEQISRLLALLRRVLRDPPTAMQPVYHDDSPLGKIAQTLLQKVTLDFDAAPLKTVLDQLTSRYGLKFRYEDRFDDTTVTLHVKNVSLGTALRRLVRDLDFSVEEENGQWLLTMDWSAQVVAGRLTSVYPVDDLLGSAAKPGPISPNDFMAAMEVPHDNRADLLSIAGRPFLVVDRPYIIGERRVENGLDLLRTLGRDLTADARREAPAIPCYYSPTEWTAREEVLKALRKKVSLRRIKAPLADVLKEIGRRAGLGVATDFKDPTGHMEITGKEPVTVIAENEEARSVLRRLLMPLKLGWRIEYGMLLIMTRDQSARALSTVAYPSLGMNPDALGDLILATVEPIE